MDDVPVSQTLDPDLAAADKRWPLIVIAAMFFAGVAPAFLSRPAPPPRPAPSRASCTSTPAPSTTTPTHPEAPKPAVETKGSC